MSKDKELLSSEEYAKRKAMKLAENKRLSAAVKLKEQALIAGKPVNK